MTAERDPGSEVGTDRGDETQQRFRAQAAYAAVSALTLLHDSMQHEEVFCEHHEDVLIKRVDGCYVGIQVKTRARDEGPFKADHERVIKSLARFVVLDVEFPEKFLYFIFATNAGTWKEKKNGKNLSYLLDLAKETTVPGDHRTLYAFVKKIVDECEKTPEQILATLKKTRIEEDLPDFADCERRVIDAISGCPELGERHYHEYKDAARKLVDHCARAAALPHAVEIIPEYVTFHDDPTSIRDRERIEGKRITRQKLLDILNASIGGRVLLQAGSGIPLQLIPAGVRVAKLKMAAGGISIRNANLAEAHKHSMEHLAVVWLRKHGPVKSREMIGHLRTLVWTECQEAEDETSSHTLYGPAMLRRVRERLRERIGEEQEEFPELLLEHLYGMAAVLTEDCTVWWGPEFDIPEEARS